METWERLHATVNVARSSSTTDALSQFCTGFDAGGLEKLGRQDYKIHFVTKVCEFLYDAKQQNDFALLLKALDTLRICAREKFGLESLTTKDTLGTLISIATSGENKAIAELSLRCLNNAIFMEENNVAERLIEVNSNGLCLLDELMKLLTEKAVPTTAHFALRFLLMLVSQCRSINLWLCRSTRSLSTLVNVVIFASNRIGTFGVFDDSRPGNGYDLSSSSDDSNHASNSSSPGAVRIEWFPRDGGWLSSDDENLVIEALKVLQALDLFGSNTMVPSDSAYDHVLVRLEAVLCHLLGLDSYPAATAGTNLIVTQAIQMALFMSSRPSSTLPAKLSSSPNYIQSLVNIFSALYEDIGRKVSTEESRTLTLSPTLALLTTCSASSPQFRTILRQHVLSCNDNETEMKKDDSESKRDNLAPKYSASTSSVRGKLLKLMTCLDPIVKRYSSELMFELCNHDAGLFVEWTGMGNAIAFLQSKGLA